MEIIWKRIIDVKDIVVSPRPVWKCKACEMYGKRLSCPPYAPDWKETRDWVSHYKTALLYKFSVDTKDFESDKRQIMEFLLKEERKLFERYPYVFALFPGSCNLCQDCAFEKGKECVCPTKVRPSLDATGIELAKLVSIDFGESVLYSMIFLE